MGVVILIGGNDRTAPTQLGERLSREIDMRQSNPHILSCNFAKGDLEERRDSEASWLLWFQKFFPSSDIVHATEQDWEYQVARADVIYLHGGHTKTLMNALPDYDKSRSLFKDKIVIGSSAGANYLANGGYSPGADGYMKGIGLVDLSVLVHYGSHERVTAKKMVRNT